MGRPWRQAFNFRGRATRREYWMFLPLLYGAWVLAIFAVALVVGFSGADDGAFDAIVLTFTFATMALATVLLLSASIRRLHDHGKSGWLFLLTLIPLVGWIFYLIMMLTPGTVGENEYGSDPRQRGFSSEDAYAVFS
jgi:uncharacterized membrane protein YhaH (DUF805 family)